MKICEVHKRTALILRINVNIMALQSIGVDVMDKQTGQMRNMYSILSDVAGKWDSLSTAQKNYISYESAGKMCA